MDNSMTGDSEGPRRSERLRGRLASPLPGTSKTEPGWIAPPSPSEPGSSEVVVPNFKFLFPQRRKERTPSPSHSPVGGRRHSSLSDSDSLVDIDSEGDDNDMRSSEDDAVEYNELSNSSFPPTHLVLRLSPNIHPEAVSWLVKKITGKKQDGGAELLVRAEPFAGRKKESLILHITASKLKFLELAEYMELKKQDKEGQLREFTVGDLDHFLHGETHLDNLLTAAEKQIIVLHELENIRSLPGEDSLPGYPAMSVFSGQSVFQIFWSEGLISAYYPLHEDQELKKLGEKWYWAFFQAQPFEDIRKYFGESISLYFSFLGFYTAALCAPAILGILHLFFPESASNYSLIFFCVFNVIWVTVTLEVWKRKCSELAYSWGTLRMTKWEDPRSNYRGKMCLDAVTGRYQPKYPWWKTALKVYGVSFPIVLICLFGAFYIMLYSFWVEEMLVEMQHEKGSQLASVLVYVPSIVYAVLVYLMNFYYRQFSNYLTEWENHRTQSQFERHRVTKLVLFEFVNNFMSLFYIAFYLQDFEMLKYQVFVMLIILQSINHFQEAILPLLIRKSYATVMEYLLKKYPKLSLIMDEDDSKGSKENNNSSSSQSDSIWSPASLGVKILDANDPRIEMSRVEGEMDPYEGTFDDYLEMFIQFGYVFLFSSVYPLAASWAILNNVLEIRADAFKLCKVFQRPMARRTKDIGAWQIAFEVMGAIAIMTNCGLLCLSPELRSWASTLTPAEWLLMFVVIEHFLLALTLALRQLIPDVPTKIKMAMARLEYQSRQALKHEQAFKSRRQLTRRFKTIHGTRGGAMGVPRVDASPSHSPAPLTRRRPLNQHLKPAAAGVQLTAQSHSPRASMII